MVSIFSSLHKSCKRLFIFLPLIIGLLINPISANALYPSDPSSVDVLKDDLHGADLHNTEYVKYDLSNQDLGEANLQGAYMSVTTAKNSSFKGANMTDLIAYATRFDNADFTDANLTNGELMKSVFDGAIIDGADLLMQILILLRENHYVKELVELTHKLELIQLIVLNALAEKVTCLQSQKHNI